VVLLGGIQVLAMALEVCSDSSPAHPGGALGAHRRRHSHDAHPEVPGIWNAMIVNDPNNARDASVDVSCPASHGLICVTDECVVSLVLPILTPCVGTALQSGSGSE